MEAEDQQDSDDLQNRILAAAKALFTHYGYKKTTVNDIARKANVAKSTIYLRWSKKDDLFGALLNQERDRLLAEWHHKIEKDVHGGTFPILYKYALQTLLASEFSMRVYQSNQRMLGGLPGRIGIEKRYAQRQIVLMQFFQQLQAIGHVREDVDAQTIAYVLNSLQYSLVQMDNIIPAEQTPTLDQRITVIVQMLESVISPKEAGDSEAGKQVIEAMLQDALAIYASSEAKI